MSELLQYTPDPREPQYKEFPPDKLLIQFAQFSYHVLCGYVSLGEQGFFQVRICQDEERMGDDSEALEYRYYFLEVRASLDTKKSSPFVLVLLFS